MNTIMFIIAFWSVVLLFTGSGFLILLIALGSIGFLGYKILKQSKK